MNGDGWTCFAFALALCGDRCQGRIEGKDP